MIQPMKKIIYILCMALMAVACAKELVDPGFNTMVDEHDPVYPDGATVDVYFSVPIPPTTRADMADLPDIDDMHVAVFDASGSLKQYEKAEITNVAGNGVANAAYFKVRLLLKSTECRLHFLANGPQKNTITGGMESALVQQWVTEYPEGAYWQRIILPEGITAYSFSSTKEDGSAWATGDYLYFYYLERTEDGITYYDHVSQGYSGAKEAHYQILFNSYGAPYYVVEVPGAGTQTVNVGDYVNAKGEKILDGTGYFQSTTVTGAVSSVPLVRNFARLKVVAGDGNFTPTEYYLMNIPDKGTIAPYSAEAGFVPEYSVSYYQATASGQTFVSEDPMIYIKSEEATKDYDGLVASLTGSRYLANMPSTASLIQTVDEVAALEPVAIPTTWTKYTVPESGTSMENVPSAFLYERGLPNKDQDPTYLLIGGTLRGHTEERWFKVELTNHLGQYFKILRDITYFLEIGQIDGSEGYATAVEAALGSPVSDVSNSVATENLEQISDGKGTSMWVSYIDYVSTNPDGEQKAILYKVYQTSSSTNAALNPMIGEGESATSRYTLSFTPEYDESDETCAAAISAFVLEDSAYSGTDTPDGKGDWRRAVVQLRPAASGKIYYSELTISGITADGETNDSGKSLSRKVKFHVMSTQRFITLSATPLQSEAIGQETKLTIKLPTGLGFSMFPLILRIEAENNNLNPVASKNLDANGDPIDLPVSPSGSYFSGGNSFGFLFTINYTDYYDRENETNPYHDTFELYFKTTKDYTNSTTGSNATWISVTDEPNANGGRYFFYKPDDLSQLYNPSVNYAVTYLRSSANLIAVTPESQDVAPGVLTATFNVNTDNDTSWIVEGGDDVTVSPTGGTGSGIVTMTFPANISTATMPRTATVKVMDGTDVIASKTATVNQAGIYVRFNGTSASVAAADTYYDIELSTNAAWTASVAQTRADDGPSLDKEAGTGDDTIRLSFPANDTEQIREYTVTISVPNTSISETFTVTQKRAASYTVNLNNWQAATASANPDPSLYDAYMSENDLGNSSISTMSLTLEGYDEFVIYIASDGEYNSRNRTAYDYLVVRRTALTRWNNATNNAIASTYTEHYSGVPSSLNGYTKVTIPLDGGTNTIYIQYGKDSSSSDGTDKGYILIPKNQ